MKLITLTILLTSLAVDVRAQKFRQEHFSFPPQFQTPNVGIFSSDQSLYLPPESHTTLPYFPMKNFNNLQYPLLPPTGTKAPSLFPTPFPFMISTTLVPNFDEDEDDDDNRRMQYSSSLPPMPQKMNQTDKRPEPPAKEKREMRAIPNNNMMFQQSIQNRNDVKFPFKLPNPASMNTSPSPANPTSANRRMIISTETQRSDLGLDQLKAAKYQGPQFIPAGQGIYVSSTTEPAIPILRLSNEMDLDGSFSYEALGADQTHYVQHSRMENMGPDKQEQVVEGSYSYVGDNGQTYTVHYIADSNGFRASGDHLPVAPPVPEIIQRAVQYNLAEEAKKPPHLRDWQDDGRDNEISNSENKNVHFAPPPTRNLFTGRTPEAFSYSYSQGSNTGNNLITAASNQTPIKTVDYTTEQPKAKPNNGPISPQITFLASQGAHIPSANTIQETISRMFTTEKSTMPQLINYEAGMKEADQEPNKGLWRWQYGINAHNLNQQTSKDTISRSSGEGDDIIINFGDMTPDQYKKMITSQFELSPESVAPNQHTQNVQPNQHPNNNFANYYQNEQSKMRIDNQNQQSNIANEYQKYQESKMINDYQKEQLKAQNEYQMNHAANKEIENQNNKESKIISGYQNQNNPSVIFEENYPSPSTVTAFPQTEDWPIQQINTNKYTQHDYQVQSTNKPIESFVQHDFQYQSSSKPIVSRKLISDTPKILTQKDFMFPTQTITQSYNFEDLFYEPRKIKSLNTDTVKSSTHNILNEVQNIHEKSITSDNNWAQPEPENKETTTQEPYISTFGSFKFTDFLVQESKSDSKPIVTTTTTEAPRVIETTTENVIEDILNNNIFLKTLFSAEKPERKHENKIVEEPEKVVHVKSEAEPKTDKIHQIIPYHQKSNDMKTFKKKPVDMAEILNYVSIKSHFESGKVKPAKSKPTSNNFDQRTETRFIPIQQEREENKVKIPEQKNNFRTLNQEQQEELRGLIKNYKVLQRNNNLKYDSSPLKRELTPPPLKSPNLPPLGRAGPSMKSYLPPIYV